jgi:hypothetical protein
MKTSHSRRLFALFFAGLFLMTWMLQGRKCPAEEKPAAKENQQAEAAQRSAPNPSAEAELKDQRLRKWGWIGLGTGAAALIGGVVTGSLALKLNGDLKDACAKNDCPQSEYGDDRDRRDLLATSTNLLLGAGGTILAVGVIILFVTRRGEKDVEPEIGFFPAAGSNFVGVGLNGRF